MSVKYGDVGSVMCSYNRIGGVYACDNADTLTDVLRNQWGFGGYVQSDFGATHSTAHSLNASEDFEMLSPTWYTPARIKAALADGSLSIDTHRPLAQAPLCADVPVRHLRPADGTIDATADGATARAIAEQTAVLLKNNPPKAPSAAPPASSESDQQGPDAGQHVAGKLLPLDASRILTIALVGQATFVNAAVAGGGGSSRVSPLYTVTPLQGRTS